MNREEIFMVWAPQNARWSPWVKPVLFAHVNPRANLAEMPTPAPIEDSWLPASDGRCAIVIDLPGDSGVQLGLQLAGRGYWPVPLYNALPSPTGFLSAGRVVAVCDIQPIITALFEGNSTLAKLRIPDDAPPAFLLDSSRRIGSGQSLTPVMFDNRSVSLPTDFPSASRMLANGIKRVLVVQKNGTSPQEDLSHTLLRWQEAGIAIELQALEGGEPTPIRVTRPRFYKIITQRLLAVAGFRQSPLGGFGGVLPIPSSG